MKFVCSPSRYAKTIKGLSEAHKHAIKKIGFGGMLHMKEITLRRTMLSKLVGRYNMETQKFLLGGTQLPMTLADVYHIMGLRIDGNEIVVHDNIKINKELFYAYKGQSSGENYITLKALEQSIAKSKYPDDHFKRQFVLYTIGLILAPTTKAHVHSKYLALVERVKDIEHFNWGQFTLSNLLSGLHNLKKEEHKNLQGNLALLQVSATSLCQTI
jgi:hypothetical protein